MAIFEGSAVAIVTPFNAKDEVNYNKLEELLNWHVKEGTDAIVICGTTGETPTTSDDEQRQLIKFAVDVIDKRIPVIAGTGSNETRQAIEMSMFAEKVGADAVLVMNPYYNKSTQRGIIAHFKAVADSINIPIIVYNVPSRTGLNITVDTIVELAKIKNIVAVKEASGDISQVAEIARLTPNDFTIYSGNDDQVVPLLSLGGKGVISVSANIIPKDLHNMVQYYLDGKVKESLDCQLKMNGLNKALFIEANPIPIKEAMNVMGMEVGHLRMPLLEMEEKNLAVLKNEMSAYGLI
ncbi:4-hydroxy-tetrahydrodipicolinate synthase [Alkalibaculum bacchi]|uniref:4-hydroxy-tetrahydrodipicolinate synthase n=1 Tax=Alkalibaculum bacchi TaxID=645887 RepID=A0A366I6A9_9FIRM|nr:4-hydroxy-tetrahydrodipicolinate synthase [Alkalibaculum bacchi]RBP63847.1 4-hydroxy-tetrahydrodipicolinate synthase [Alkalibaculum bacchi]